MSAFESIIKYPRTRHIEGSRLQPGDQDLRALSFDQLRSCHLVVEEKLDGANAGLGFSESGELQLQSRGHYLTGGGREKHFDLFKQWAHAHAAQLRDIVGHRYLVYGEWLYAKHTVFYDRLPSYFMEFDVYDRESQEFLSTERRREMFEGSPVSSVPVLRSATFDRLDELTSLVGRSLYKTANWQQRLREAATARGVDIEQTVRQTDSSDEMEGLYVKHEEHGRVVGRYKWVRASFITAVVDSESHWLSRPIVPNQLEDGQQ
jgi:hypothetical protein